MAEVALQHVSKTFPNGVQALHDVSLTVADGELMVLVGPSGCGKTTTLRLIAGLESPTAGTLAIGGRVVNSVPPRDRDVALVFQQHVLYPHLNVRRNLSFSLEMRHPQGWFRRWLFPRPRALIQQRVAEAAQMLGLEDVLERLPAQLSGGQQQRVALGRALVRQPAVFLLDEPLSHLDVRLRTAMRRELHLLQRRLHATMIYVTHDPDSALMLGDRIVVLDRGMVQQVDRPQVLYDRPANRRVAAFIGWPPMSFLEGALGCPAGEPEFVVPDARLRAPAAWLPQGGRPLTLGIRPEDVSLARSSDMIRSKESSPATDQPILMMEVTLVEPVGFTTLVTVQRGDWELTAMADGRQGWSVGQKVPVMLNLQRAHLFDRGSGLALTSGAPAG